MTDSVKLQCETEFDRNKEVMVRMDLCVTSLYSVDGTTNRRKTLEIVKVMKGAVSISRSHTGEFIYRSSKTEKNNLKRQLQQYAKMSADVVTSIGVQQRTVMRHWGQLVERQKTSYKSFSQNSDPVEKIPRRKYSWNISSRLDDEVFEESLDNEEVKQDRLLHPVEKPTVDSKRPLQANGSLADIPEDSRMLLPTMEQKNMDAAWTPRKKLLKHRTTFRNLSDPGSTTVTSRAPSFLAHEQMPRYARMLVHKGSAAGSPTNSISPLPEIKSPSNRNPPNKNEQDAQWVSKFLNVEKEKQERLIIRNTLARMNTTLPGAPPKLRVQSTSDSMDSKTIIAKAKRDFVPFTLLWENSRMQLKAQEATNNDLQKAHSSNEVNESIIPKHNLFFPNLENTVESSMNASADDKLNIFNRTENLTPVRLRARSKTVHFFSS
ncbi:hypothetical protein ScPMuIL_006810 [Solemya velum]